MRIRRLLSILLLFVSALAFGQGSIATGVPTVTNALGQPIPNATVAVCTTDPGSPVTGGCPTHLATLYTDVTIGTPCTGTAQPLSNPGGAGSGCSNPGTTDSNGNVVAFAGTGQYWCEYYGTAITGVKVIPCIFPWPGDTTYAHLDGSNTPFTGPIGFNSYIYLSNLATPASAANKLRVYSDTSNRFSFVNGSGYNNFLSAAARHYGGMECVADGDSITAGTGLGTPTTQNWFAQVTALEFLTGRCTNGSGAGSNFAVSGSKIADVSARYAGSVYPLRPAATGAPKSLLFVLVGINDIKAAANGTTLANSIISYANTAKADGFTVVLFTMYSVTAGTSALTPSESAQLLTMNSVLRGTPTAWDYLVDLNNAMQSTNDINIIQGDFLHPNLAGATDIARYVNGALEGDNSFGKIIAADFYALGTGSSFSIGTLLPLNKLHVSDTSTNTATITNEGQISIENLSGAANTHASLLFRSGSWSTTVPMGKIDFQSTGSGSIGNLCVSNNSATGITQCPLRFDYQGTNGRVGIGNIAPGTDLDVNGTTRSILYNTTTNCSSAGGTCSAASAGSVSIGAGATTVTVATTAVTANSQIFVQEDSSLGTKLSVTCNVVTGRLYTVTARTASTSFVITSSAAPAANPACLSYHIVN